MVAKQQELGLPRVHCREHSTDSRLLLIRGVDLFRVLYAAHPSKQAFIVRSTVLPPQFIETFPDGRAVQPRFGRLALGRGIPPKLQEDLHGQFLGARGVPHHPGDHAGYRLIVLSKDNFEIGPRFRSVTRLNLTSKSVHNSITPPKQKL
jgi:hypothetical protein